MQPSPTFSPLRLLRLLAALLAAGICLGYAPPALPPSPPSVAQLARQDFLAQQRQWVDRQLARLSWEEQIGQLFMVAAYSEQGEGHAKELEALVSRQGIGGLIFMQGGPGRQATLCNRLQAKAKVPLLIGMDAEWGLGMRLDSVVSYPKQMTLGAIGDNRVIEEMGEEIARQCRRLGVHVNFAPVVDVNVNPNNPVIGTRSFGEVPRLVAEKGIAYMRGLQRNGVIATAKHFPGHGDTDQDSHLTLPTIAHGLSRLDSVELYPFKRLIADSLMGVMVAHLHVPAYDDAANRASTLSPAIVTDLLQRQLGFKGLIFTDALNMQGVAKYHRPGEIEVKALLAGNDVLLFSPNVQAGIQGVKQAVESGQISKETIEAKVRKVLGAKYFVGLHQYRPTELAGLYEDLNSNRALLAKQRLYEQAVTVVRDPAGLLPFRDLSGRRFASVSIGAGKGTLQQYLSHYAPFAHFEIPNGQAPISTYQSVLEQAKGYGTVVVSLHGMNGRRSQQYGIPPNALPFIERLAQHTQVVVVVMGHPYSLRYLEKAPTLVCAYEEDELLLRALPQVLFGAVGNRARLPVSASLTLPAGSGADVASLRRLAYTFPEAVGADGIRLERRIDSLMAEAIRQSATPGGQVLLAKDGKVVFQKAYGHHTYSGSTPVTTESVYDLASLTKVLASLPAAMRLNGEGRFELHRRVKDYLPDAAGTNKGNLVWTDILTHQAGLQPFVPLYDYALKRPHLLSESKSADYPLPVAEQRYAWFAMPDTVRQWTYDFPLRYRSNIYRPFGYKYSDTGFYLLMWALEGMTNQALDAYVAEQFYAPLGLPTLGYRPLERLPKARLVPTELDRKYRGGLLQGYVDDPGASLLGGVAGHAGLFANARDVAVMMQLFLQDGAYGGKQYWRTGTMAKFNTRPYEHSNDNRRAIGWDKPVLKGHGGATSPYASHETFGHTGFTGTSAWADPKRQLVCIFLSNRIHPYIGNNKLVVGDFREQAMTIFYEALGISEKR